MQPEDLRSRVKQFALRIIRLHGNLPAGEVPSVIGRQCLRSGTSVGAHYCEASRSRSNAEFISKIEAGLQELEETRYWLELLVESGLVVQERLRGLLEEIDELTRIFVASVRTAKQHRARPDPAGCDGR